MKVFVEQPGEKNTKNVFDKENGALLKRYPRTECGVLTSDG